MIFKLDKEIFNNSNSPFLEDIWFRDDLDNFFGGESEESLSLNKKVVIRYSIKDYQNSFLNTKYSIKRDYQNSQNFIFYRIGFMQIPPVRIIIKDLDD